MITIICNSCNHQISLLLTSDSLICPVCKKNYPVKDGIIVLNETVNTRDYNNEIYSILTKVEQKHFWFWHRKQIVLWTLKKIMNQLKGKTVLDIGCGTGFILFSLEKEGMLTCGTDMHLSALQYSRFRIKGDLLCSSLDNLPFLHQFDLVLLCDVIEHLTHDITAIRQAIKTMKKDGLILITVPANPNIWSQIDELSGHKQRYTKETLIHVMKESGLKVKFIQYYNIPLLPLQALRKTLLTNHYNKLNIINGHSLELIKKHLSIPVWPLNNILSILSCIDFLLWHIQGVTGASLIAVGQPL